MLNKNMLVQSQQRTQSLINSLWQSDAYMRQ